MLCAVPETTLPVTEVVPATLYLRFISERSGLIGLCKSAVTIVKSSKSHTIFSWRNRSIFQYANTRSLASFACCT